MANLKQTYIRTVVVRELIKRYALLIEDIVTRMDRENVPEEDLEKQIRFEFDYVLGGGK